MKSGDVAELLKDYELSDFTNPLKSSWMGDQTDCKKIKIVNYIVDLSNVFEDLKARCAQDISDTKYKVNSVKIMSYAVIVSKNINFTGLKETPKYGIRDIKQSWNLGKP